MPRHDANRDPLAGVEQVIVDGNNLGHAAARAGGPEPATALVARIRAAVPASVAIEIVFDGPASGGVRGRIASGVSVTYAGREPADAVIVRRAESALDQLGPAGTWRILVVTDDRGLRDAVRRSGARVAGTDWLLGRGRRRAAIGRVPPSRG